MKPQNVFNQLERVLENEYEVTSNARIANWINIGAGLIIIGIILSAIWKIEHARRNRNAIKKRADLIKNQLKADVGPFASAF